MNEGIVNYIKQIIRCRLADELKDEQIDFPEFNFDEDDTAFSKFVVDNELALPEVIALLTGLLPHIAPGFLTSVLSEYHPDGSEFPEFGGIKGTNYRGIIPTGETLMYIIGGTDIEKRLLIAHVFEQDHLFNKQSILSLGNVEVGEPKVSGRLILDQECIDLFLYGYVTKPKMSSDFPAELMETNFSWNDLVLNNETKSQVSDILMWLKYNDALMGDLEMEHKVKPGYRVMFYGPPGVGKTLTASLLGKETGRDVYRVDLSVVVSKYIGETEKNLSKLFDKAQNKDWILFFDEADAIYGKRTGVRDAHDKYANQEVSYLLQRIEAYPGLIILASNYKSNIDQAFIRRFQSIVEFENPNSGERLDLWKKYLPVKLLTKDLNLDRIATKYDVTGANIVNIAQHACLKTLEQEQETINEETLVDAIKREYTKESRMI